MKFSQQIFITEFAVNVSMFAVSFLDSPSSYSAQYQGNVTRDSGVDF